MSAFTCADCPLKPCREAGAEKYPSGCPTADNEQSVFKDLYDETDMKIAHHSAITEGTCYGKCTRVEETMDFAYRMGFRKIGIGFCVGLSNEARTLAKVLRSNGFEVEAFGCKCGSVPKTFIGVEKDNWVNPEREFEIMCNPAGQAHLLDERGCELNIILGLCVGHDTLFIRHSKAPVTVLSGKDRVTGNNPIQPLYVADSQYTRLYSYIERTYGKRPDGD